MATAKAISANPEKNNGSTAAFAGGSSSINTVDFGATSDIDKVNQPNTGQTAIPVSGGNFNVDNKLTAFMVTETIGGNSVNILKGGAGHKISHPINRFASYNKIALDSFNLLDGTATYGATAGDVIQASGQDGTVGAGADDAANPTMSIPGEFVYQKGTGTPIQDEYDARTL